MPDLRLTKAAQADMLGIGRYTRHRLRREQMRRHVGGLDACFYDLTSHPELGRLYLELPPYRRLIRGKQVG
jgi:plasmid stabilization system protein ParE